MEKRLIFIDTETTGLSPKQGHRIVELAAVETISGKFTGRVFHTYLDPQRDVDFGAMQIHDLVPFGSGLSLCIFQNKDLIVHRERPDPVLQYG